MAYGEYAIKEEFRFIDRVRFRKGESITLDGFRYILEAKCDENGIPIAFRMDSLKTGGFLNKVTEDVLILYHPDHISDYLSFLVRITHQGNYAFLDIYNLGGSKNFRNDIGASGDSAVAIGRKMINSLSGHNAKLQEERNYYTILKDCMNDVIDF